MKLGIVNREVDVAQEYERFTAVNGKRSQGEGGGCKLAIVWGVGLCMTLDGHISLYFGMNFALTILIYRE